MSYSENEGKSAVKKHLLNDRSFTELVKLQQEIVLETGWMPSLNKLVNALVNTDTLNCLKEIMLMEFKDRKKNSDLQKK